MVFSFPFPFSWFPEIDPWKLGFLFHLILVNKVFTGFSERAGGCLSATEPYTAVLFDSAGNVIPAFSAIIHRIRLMVSVSSSFLRLKVNLHPKSEESRDAVVLRLPYFSSLVCLVSPISKDARYCFSPF